MQTKISKTLEGLIARTAFDTSKQGETRWLKDRLLLEIVREEGSLAYQLLSARLKDWELYQVRLRIERDLQERTDGPAGNPEEFYVQFANELRKRYRTAPSVSTAHALHAIISDEQTIGAHVLEMYHITPAVVEDEIRRMSTADEPRAELHVRLLDYSEQGQRAAEGSRMLDKFGVDLTRQAREGKIDPVIGRECEIERVVQILSRRKKNNPILIGEAGVGKSAIVEGLALRIAAGDVPYTIAGKRLYSLDVSSLVAGTKFRGEFEERMQQLLDELRKADDTIIFIDEIHTIVGAGSTQGSLDTAISSNRRLRAANCRPSAPRRSTSTARTSRRTRRSNAASSACWSNRLRARRRSKFCATSRPATRRTTKSATRTRRSKRA